MNDELNEGVAEEEPKPAEKPKKTPPMMRVMKWDVWTLDGIQENEVGTPYFAFYYPHKITQQEYDDIEKLTEIILRKLRRNIVPAAKGQQMEGE